MARRQIGLLGQRILREAKDRGTLSHWELSRSVRRSPEQVLAAMKRAARTLGIPVEHLIKGLHRHLHGGSPE